MFKTAILLAAFAAAAGVHADIFDAPEDAVTPTAPNLSPADQAKAARQKLRLIPDITKPALLERIQTALTAVKKTADAAAAEGDTKTYDSLKPIIADLDALLARTRAEPFLPSLYPLAVTRRGCLSAVSERTLKPANTSVTLPQTTWFSVKATSVATDGSIPAEIYDATGQILLYHAILKGMDPLPVGRSAKLVNVAFECVAEEQGSDHTIYHLKRIPAVSIAQK